MQEEGEESMNRGFKNCEAFCNRLRRNYPQTYAYKYFIKESIGVVD